MYKNITKEQEEKLREEYEKKFYVKILPHDSIDASKAELMNIMLKSERSLTANFWLQKIDEIIEERNKELIKISFLDGYAQGVNYQIEWKYLTEEDKQTILNLINNKD